MNCYGFLSIFALTMAYTCFAETPSTSYIFPAGGQRGTEVKVRVGGHYLHDLPPLEVLGTGVTASPEMARIDRIWFEGPIIRQPASQQKEDYPQDYAAEIKIAADATSGVRLWRTWTAQGATGCLPFVVGDLPEVVEEENDGRPIPVAVSLPVTINGRIFPREDVDVWSFEAKRGESVTCSVAAAELGSPLEARLEVRDEQGRIVAEGEPRLGKDPQLRFTASADGRYLAHITDCRYSGLQDHVYRLTITKDTWIDRIYPLGGRRGSEVAFELVGQRVPSEVLQVKLPDVAPRTLQHGFTRGGKPSNLVLLDIDEFDERLETPGTANAALQIPSVANGRIANAGEIDPWPFAATKDQAFQFQVRAARLGSPLDAVLVIRDSTGKELARADDLPDGASDCELSWTAPVEGNYIAEVSEKFASRGGPAFAYRLRVVDAKPDFSLQLVSDNFAVDVGTEKKLPVNIIRGGGFNGPIKLSIEGLPAGTSAAELVVQPGQNRGELAIKVEKSSPVQLAKVKIIGEADISGSVKHAAAIVLPNGLSAPHDLLLVCTLPTPFKYKGEFQLRYIARGGVLKKSFKIERNGFDGPIEVRLAERQGRHLQGVTGPTVVVPPGQDQFDYHVLLPPWMELGRTSRSNLMLTGEVADASGKKHKVSFSTTEQNEQLIALVSPSSLRLSLEQSTYAIVPGGELKLKVRLHRGPSLTSDCKVELDVPSHMKDITAESQVVPGDAEMTELVIKFGAHPGPLNRALAIKATATHDGDPVLAETPLELVIRE